jgi:hypothetical protein
MNNLALAMVWLALFATSCGAAQPLRSYHEALPSKLVAVSPQDNDLDPNGDPVGPTTRLPASVGEVCRTLAEDAVKNWTQVCQDGEECDVDVADFFGPIVRLKSPDQRELYVFKRTYLFGASFYFFILYDPKTERATASPPSIYRKWMDGDGGAPLEKPIVKFHDFDGDGRVELIVQERVHNGTMYNAVIYHHFHIGTDLSLRRILAIETRLFDLFTESERGVIERTPRLLSPFEVKLEVELKRAHPIKSVESLGEVISKRSDLDSPFQVAERHVGNARYADFLVTAYGPEEENRILSEGYRGYY